MNYYQTGRRLLMSLVCITTALLLSLMPVKANALTETKITPDQQREMGLFGFSLAIDGDYLIGGANVFEAGAGCAFVFKRQQGEWIQQARLAAENVPPVALFGNSVDIEGEHAIVGAPLTLFDSLRRDNSDDRVYIFSRNNEEWSVEAELASDDGEAGDDFGGMVAICGDYAAVAARYDSHPGLASAGSVYIFNHTDAGWVQTQKLIASDADSIDSFGADIDLSEEWLAIGAPDDRNNEGMPAGSTYFFHLEDGEWVEHSKVNVADDAGPFWFGMDISLSGGRVAIAKWSDSDAVPGVTAYVFRLVNDVWTFEARVNSAEDRSGDWITSVALSGDYLVLGNLSENDPARFAGAVYMFEYADGAWTEIEKIKASDAKEGAMFGNTLAIDQNCIFIGADNDSSNGVMQCGAIYIYSDYNPNIADKEPETPRDFALLSAYPNPFNATTQINYQLPSATTVRLVITDLNGHPLETLVNGEISAGNHTVLWNAAERPSGVYIVRLEYAGQTKLQKLMLVR